jgi:hypothetical protein
MGIAEKRQWMPAEVDRGFDVFAWALNSAEQRRGVQFYHHKRGFYP